jgi:ATP-dependent Clp protease ATP-binding subunit ClpA
VLALAAKEARALNHTYVGTEHILLGLLREGTECRRVSRISMWISSRPARRS